MACKWSRRLLVSIRKRLTSAAKFLLNVVLFRRKRPKQTLDSHEDSDQQALLGGQSTSERSGGEAQGQHTVNIDSARAKVSPSTPSSKPQEPAVCTSTTSTQATTRAQALASGGTSPSAISEAVAAGSAEGGGSTAAAGPKAAPITDTTVALEAVKVTVTRTDTVKAKPGPRTPSAAATPAAVVRTGEAAAAGAGTGGAAGAAAGTGGGAAATGAAAGAGAGAMPATASQPTASTSRPPPVVSHSSGLHTLTSKAAPSTAAGAAATAGTIAAAGAAAGVSSAASEPLPIPSAPTPSPAAAASSISAKSSVAPRSAVKTAVHTTAPSAAPSSVALALPPIIAKPAATSTTPSDAAPPAEAPSAASAAPSPAAAPPAEAHTATSGVASITSPDNGPVHLAPNDAAPAEGSAATPAHTAVASTPVQAASASQEVSSQAGGGALKAAGASAAVPKLRAMPLPQDAPEATRLEDGAELAACASAALPTARAAPSPQASPEASMLRGDGVVSIAVLPSSRAAPSPQAAPEASMQGGDGVVSAEEVSMEVGEDESAACEHAREKGSKEAGGGVVEVGAASSARPAPVGADFSYLQDLIETNLGPPKFSTPKPAPPPDLAQAKNAGGLPPSDSLQQLLDREFGPPKFAVPKQEQQQQQQQQQQQPRGDAHRAGDASLAGTLKRGSQQVPDSSPACQPHLRLEVIAGPAAGAIFKSTDIDNGLKAGRYPDCSFVIHDQEVSGRHAVFYYSKDSGGWKVADLGSLNGTVLNSDVISHEDRRPGEPHDLCDRDEVELGSLTRLLVKCSPSESRASKKAKFASSLSSPSGVSASTQDEGGASSSSGPATSLPQYSLSPMPAHVHVGQMESLKVLMAVHQRIGLDHRRNNTPIEDVVHWEDAFPPFKESALFCVFDGHQGTKAATLAKEIMPGVMRRTLAEAIEGTAAAGAAVSNGAACASGSSSSSSGGCEQGGILSLGSGGTGGGGGDVGGIVSHNPLASMDEMLKQVFLETDSLMASDEGCTATALLMQRTRSGGLAMQSANVGDSSALVINVSTGEWKKLTVDHRIAGNAAERQRLQERGHTVRSRLYGLNISRMLGDKFLKDEDLGFLAEPHVSAPLEVPAGERVFIILASDGLWDVMTEQRAASMVLKAVAEDPTLSASTVADVMLDQAVSLRSKDDISVMVLQSMG